YHDGKVHKKRLQVSWRRNPTMEHQHRSEDATIVRDPVCGMTVDPAATPHHARHAGREFHFCGAGCKSKFEADPAAYLSAVDPVCGMDVDRATARFMSKHEGRRYYFCSAGCQQRFEAAPDTFLAVEP